jgi:hypothetical protein
MAIKYNDEKPAVESVTIQGALLTLFGSIAAYYESAGKLPLGGATPFITGFGAILSILGRLKAVKRIAGIF